MLMIYPWNASVSVGEASVSTPEDVCCSVNIPTYKNLEYKNLLGYEFHFSPPLSLHEN